MKKQRGLACAPKAYLDRNVVIDGKDTNVSRHGIIEKGELHQESEDCSGWCEALMFIVVLTCSRTRRDEFHEEVGFKL